MPQAYPRIDPTAAAAKQARHDLFIGNLMALEQAISGYNDPQYPAQYTNAKSQLVSLFNDMNLRLARAETTITRNNTARAKRNQAKLAVTLLNVDAKHPGIIS